MHVLHLVLYSEEDIYIRMANATKYWYQRFETDDVKTFYYFYDSKVSEITQTDMFLHIPGKETFIPGILDKTLIAIEHLFLKNTYDFVVRSNASTVINFKALLPILQVWKAFPHTFYGGTLVQSTTSIQERDGIINANMLPLRFVNGTCIILNSMATKLLLAKKELIHHELIDDLSLAVFFKQTLEDEKMPEQIGNQFLGLFANYNLDTVNCFRNQNFHDREKNCDDIEKEVRLLTERYIKIPKQRPIIAVFYHTKEVTPFIIVLCKENEKWSTDGSNARLDFLFGDPQPQVLKILHLKFQDGTFFSHAAKWTFYIDTQTKKLMAY